MLQRLFPRMSQRMRLSLLMLFMTVALALIYLATRPAPPPVDKAEEAPPTRAAIEQGPVIDFSTLDADGHTETMAERKQRYGIQESVDMVVTSDESIRVGDETLDMRDYEEKDALSKGEIVIRPLTGSGVRSAAKDYGIHVVRPGDNIWKIHFRLLRESLASRGIMLPPDADRPDEEGYSSGVGRVLKFSERMVRIYSMKEKLFADNIHIIHPFEKIIIYNMEEIKGLLDAITEEDVNRIRFDGENLWISAH